MSAGDVDAGRPGREEGDVFARLTDDLLDLVATEIRESDLYAMTKGDCCCLACCSCCCVGGGN
jgi:hypothetical protein